MTKVCEHLALCCRVCVQRLISHGIMCDFKRIFIRRASMTIRGLQALDSFHAFAVVRLRRNPTADVSVFSARFEITLPRGWTAPKLKKTFPRVLGAPGAPNDSRDPFQPHFPSSLPLLLIWEQPSADYLDLRPCTESMLYLQQSLWWGEGMFPGSSEQLQQGRAAQYW